VKLKVLIHPAEEGGYWAEVPSLRGCYSQGETLEEVYENIREAIEGWLEVAGEEVQSKGDAQIAEIEV
jgi:predicted RNase H-like HicB family nuclease